MINLSRALKCKFGHLCELFSVNLYIMSNCYEVSVHYILGENDINTPTEFRIVCCDTIDVNCKSIITIPDE